MSLPASDNFTRADANNLGANWTPQFYNGGSGPGLGIFSNQCAAYGDGLAVWTADAFGNNHYSQGTFTSSYNLLLVRCSGTGITATAYACLGYVNNLYITLITGPTGGGFGTTIGTLGAYVDGDVIRLEVVGTSIKAYVNGVQSGSTVIDATLSTGAPGVAQLNSSSPRIDSWMGDNVGGAVAAPFIPFVFPLPRVRGFVTAANFGPNLLLTTLAPSQAVPFKASDWLSPLRPVDNRNLRGFIRETNLNLVGQDRFFGLAGSPTFDWPIPQGKPHPVFLRGDVHGSGILVFGRDTFFGVAGNPNADWSNPQGKPFPVDLRTHINDGLLYQLSSQAPPFKPVMFDNPQGKPYPTELRQFMHDADIQLFGKDTFFGLAGHPNFDWPNPTGKPYHIDLRTYVNDGLLYLLTIPPPPFVPAAFDNPQGKPFPIGLRTFIGERKQYYADIKPFSLTEWPNPRVGGSAIDLRTWVANLLESTLVPTTQAPFSQTDWPNPLPRMSMVDLRTIAGNLPQALIAYLYTPFAQTDWPNPQGKPFPFVLRSHLSTRALVLSEPIPISQSDWSMPQGKPFPVALRTFVDWRKLGYVDPIPVGRLQDWPIPRGKNPELRTFLIDQQSLYYPMVPQTVFPKVITFVTWPDGSTFVTWPNSSTFFTTEEE